MKRAITSVLIAGIIVWAAPMLRADVKTQHKTTFKMGGALGGLMNRFAGDAAKDGAVEAMSIKGNRQLTSTAQSGKIIDLTEEKVYDLDMRKKEYRVTTFAELRRQWQEQQKKMQEGAQGGGGQAEATDPAQSGKQIEITASVKETGATKKIAGYDTKEVVVTVMVHEKGKTLEESGGLSLVSSFWMAPRVGALDEATDFQQKYFKAIYGDAFVAADMAAMGALLAQYPSMKELQAKMSAESKKLQGTPMLTTMTMEAVKSAEQMKAGAQPAPSSGGGLMGRLANRMGNRGGGNAGEAKSSIFTSSVEVLSVETSVADGDVAIPAGFKEKK
jgi:hypothetical protein